MRHVRHSTRGRLRASRASGPRRRCAAACAPASPRSSSERRGQRGEPAQSAAAQRARGRSGDARARSRRSPGPSDEAELPGEAPRAPCSGRSGAVGEIGDERRLDRRRAGTRRSRRRRSRRAKQRRAAVPSNQSPPTARASQRDPAQTTPSSASARIRRRPSTSLRDRQLREHDHDRVDEEDRARSRLADDRRCSSRTTGRARSCAMPAAMRSGVQREHARRRGGARRTSR